MTADLASTASPTPSPTSIPAADTSSLTISELVSRVAGEQPAALSIVLGALADPQTDGRDVDAMLQLTVGTAVAAVDGCDAAGVTVVQPSGSTTSAWAPPSVVATGCSLDGDHTDCPCLHVVRTWSPVRITVDESGHTWPDVTGSATGSGVLSLLVCPLPIDGFEPGVLTLHSRSRHGFTEPDEAVATLICRIAGSHMAAHHLQHRADLLVAQLEEAVSSRAVIEQAKGAVAVVRQISPEDAFALMRTISQHTNVKLRDVATRTLRDFGAHLP